MLNPGRIHSGTTARDRQDRVRGNSPASSNIRVDRDIEDRIRAYQTRTAAEISERIGELDREWDIERAIEANAATIALAGVLLGAFVSNWWLVVPVVVTVFLLQHAIQGWCPPVPVLRKLGFRTRKEIDREKFALKVVRGDFASFEPPATVADADRAARHVLELVS
jgi:hypothetical protein